MIVEPSVGPKRLQARILDTPTLQYGAGSRQQTIVSFTGLKGVNLLTLTADRNLVTELGTCALYIPHCLLQCFNNFAVTKGRQEALPSGPCQTLDGCGLRT